MVSVFEALDDVGMFHDPRWPEGVRPYHLLWPVWCRRVATPVDSGDELGPFERAVLNCARAGQTDPEHVADLLCLDRKFVQLIRDSLRASGTLLRDNRISTKGIEALEQGSICASEIRPVYSFTCAMSGQLLPRFSDQIYYAVTKRSQNRTKLEISSDKGTREVSCFRLIPTNPSIPPVPTATDLVRAAERQLIDRRNESLRRRGENADEPPAPLPPATLLQRVHVIDETPHPLFLATIVYQDIERPIGDDGFVVEDPFGFGPNRRLRDRLRDDRKNDHDLARWLSIVIETDAGGTTLRDDHRLYWRACTDEVLGHLAPTRVPKDLIEALAAIEYNQLMAKDDGIRTEQAAMHLRAAGKACRDALEGAFLHLAERFPLSVIRTPVEQLGLQDRETVQRRLKRACIDLGFDQTIPSRLAAVKPNQLKAVVIMHHYSQLAAFIAASLIVADLAEGHPFRALAKHRPGFLHELQDALAVAGEAAHFKSGPTPEEAAINTLRSIAYDCVRLAADAQDIPR